MTFQKATLIVESAADTVAAPASTIASAHTCTRIPKNFAIIFVLRGLNRPTRVSALLARADSTARWVPPSCAAGSVRKLERFSKCDLMPRSECRYRIGGRSRDSVVPRPLVTRMTERPRSAVLRRRTDRHDDARACLASFRGRPDAAAVIVEDAARIQKTQADAATPFVERDLGVGVVGLDRRDGIFI